MSLSKEEIRHALAERLEHYRSDPAGRPLLALIIKAYKQAIDHLDGGGRGEDLQKLVLAERIINWPEAE
jgi:hypothetical protein